MQKTKLLLGAHMSIAGGFDRAVELGESIDCTAIQIFTRSNRQWGAKKLTQEAIELFREALKGSCVRSVVAHLPYLLNIGSPHSKTRYASISVLKQELKRCHALGIKSMVLHPGSSLDGTKENCLERIIKGLDTALASDTEKTMILLENMAGQGTNVGYDFKQLGYILKNVNKKSRVGVCFDTCHAFAAGYDFRTPETYEAMWKEFGKEIGLRKLKVIHVNDSKRELSSHVDRHENIDKGKLGREAFRLLFNDPRFFSVPKILETPKPTLELYAKNMAVLKRLLTPKTKKLLRVD